MYGELGKRIVAIAVSVVTACNSSNRRLEMKSFARRNSKCIRPEPETLQRGGIHAAGRITLMLGGLILGGFAGTLAIAQGTLSAKAPISPEAMAIHVQAKRHVAQPVTTLEPAVALAATASTVNSAQGPGGGEQRL